MTGLSPVGAPLLAVFGGAALASLPADAVLACRVLAPSVAILTLGLTLLASASAADEAAWGFASVVALLGATSSLAFAGDPSFGGLLGRRLRMARAIPSLMVGAALVAVTAPGQALSICALSALALLSSLATGSARGSAAAIASWRLMRLQIVAIAGCLVGLFLSRNASAPAGAVILLLGLAALAGAAPFGTALRHAAALADAPLAALTAGLLPLAALALVLRARLPLVGSGFGPVVDGALLLSGLLSVAGGAGLVWVRADANRRNAAASRAVFGLVVFAFGLGDEAGLHAGLIGLLAASFAVPATVLAGRLSSGWLRNGSSLAASCAPPFGLFAAWVLVTEDSLARTPWLLVPWVVVSCVLFGGCLRGAEAALDRPAPTRAVRAMLAVHLVIAAIIGLALPSAVSDRVVDMAEHFAGATG